MTDLGSLIRWLHVASMAGLLGGAMLLSGVSLRRRRPEGSEGTDALLTVAQTYEWLFWTAVGLLVMTGVGNLGAFGSSLPDRETAWGGKLIVKLGAVAALMLLSLLRTLLVVYLGATRHCASPVGRSIVGAGYAGTALLGAGILAVAVSLAHG